MAGKGGGAWKVAYADFVTAMMAFFLVMWITAQNKEAKTAVAQYFQNPLGTIEEARATSVHGIEGASADVPLHGQQAGPYGTNKDGVGNANSPRDPSNSKPIPPPQRIFERLDKTRSLGLLLVFEESSATITDESREQLLRMVTQLLGKPNKIEIRGHASRQPPSADSPYKTPWDLCFARCTAVRDLLVEQGIEMDRFRLSQDGTSEPYGPELRDEEVRGLASRVEVYAISEYMSGHKETLLDRVGRMVDPEDAPPDPHGPPAKAAPAQDGHGGHGGGHGGHGSHGGHGDAAHGKSGHGSSGHGSSGHGQSGHGPSGHGAAAKGAAAHSGGGHGGSSHGGSPAAPAKSGGGHGHSHGH